VMEGKTSRLRHLGLAGLGASLAGLSLAVTARGRAVAYLSGRIPRDSMLGPADVPGAWALPQRALAHRAILSPAARPLLPSAPGRQRAAAGLALLHRAGDLAVANAWVIWTVPQAKFDAPSEAARLIEAAERSDPSAGPFRVHRIPGGWFPGHFATTRSSHRL